MVAEDPAGAYQGPQMSDATSNPIADRVGMLVATVCLAHCLALPAVFAFLPAFAAMWGGEWVHVLLVGAAVPVSGWALLRGVQSHGDPVVAGLGAAGLGIIFAAAVEHVPLTVEYGAMIAGTVLLLMAHRRNIASY